MEDFIDYESPLFGETPPPKSDMVPMYDEMAIHIRLSLIKITAPQWGGLSIGEWVGKMEDLESWVYDDLNDDGGIEFKPE